MDKNIIVQTWIATLVLHNGQTVEWEVKAKSKKKAREKAKELEQVKQVLEIKKQPKI